MLEMAILTMTTIINDNENNVNDMKNHIPNVQGNDNIACIYTGNNKNDNDKNSRNDIYDKYPCHPNIRRLP